MSLSERCWGQIWRDRCHNLTVFILVDRSLLIANTRELAGVDEPSSTQLNSVRSFQLNEARRHVRLASHTQILITTMYTRHSTHRSTPSLSIPGIYTFCFVSKVNRKFET